MNLADIIAAHRFVERSSISQPSRCYCGWVGDQTIIRLGRDVWVEWAAHVAAEIEKALTVRTVEELDALPQGALIEHQGAVYRNRKFINLWQEVDWQRLDHDAAALLPARILWLPTDETTT